MSLPSFDPVLVTGATSHTGERVVAQLLQSGRRVRILTRDPEKPRRLGMDFSRFEMRQGDLSQPWTLWEALEGCQALVHVAHIRFGAVCVRACQAAGVQRLVSISSTRRFTRWPCETSRAVNRGEAAIQSSPLDWTLLRSAMIYGGARDNNISRLIVWVRKHRWVPLVDGGRTRIQPVHVDDLAALFVRALDRPETFRRTFTVAGPAPVSYRELMKEIALLLGRPQVRIPIPGPFAVGAGWLLETSMPFLRVRCEQVRRLCEDKVFDISETQAALGFSPRSVPQGLRDKLVPAPGNPALAPLGAPPGDSSA